MIGDGLFHLGTYIFTVAGLVLLWRGLHQQHRQVRTTTLIGGLLLGWGLFNLIEGLLLGWGLFNLIEGLLLGWGLFNLIEGLVDHHLLQVHHVRSGPNQLLWDIGFLLWGAVMAAAGAMLMWRRANTSVEEA